MVEPNKQSNQGDDSPENRDQKKAPSDPSNQVVDELKKFLSGLKGESSSTNEESPPSPSPSPSEDPLSDADAFTFSQLNNPSDAPGFFQEKEDADPFSFGMDNPFNDLAEQPQPEQKQPEKPKPPPEAPSDKDFWEENILGWQDEPKEKPTGEPKKSPEVEPKDEAVSPEPAPNESLLPSENPTITPFGLEQIDEQIKSLSQSFPSSPSQPGGEIEQGREIDLNRTPEPSPTEGESGPLKEPDPEMEIPIPGTVEKKEKPASVPEPNWEAEDMKPEGLQQIACLFPEGEEAQAKVFIKKLRDAGNRGNKPIDIRAAFIQPYLLSQLDWKVICQSCSTAGADTIFLLVKKEEKEAAQKIVSDAPSVSWKGRIIRLDQVPTRALYADLALELGKSNS